MEDTLVVNNKNTLKLYYSNLLKLHLLIKGKHWHREDNWEIGGGGGWGEKEIGNADNSQE